MSQPPAPLADLQRLLGVRDRRGINTLLATWLDRDLAVGERWGIFADILAQHGEWTLALRAVRRHRAAAPDDRMRRFAEAVMLARAGHNADARACAAPLLEASPRDLRLAHFMGALSSEAGLFDDARRYFGMVLDADPRSGQTWLELSAIHRFTQSDPLLARLRRTVSDGVPNGPRAPLLYAWGKASDDIGDIDAAFSAFAQGAALTSAERPYDAAADRAQADMVLTAWDGVALPHFDGAAGSTRLFVTGLPRSGTTLVEHSLASHPAVAGGGELNLLSTIAQEAGGLGPDALATSARAGRRQGALVKLYDHLVGERFAPGARVVDKTLDASRMLGLVATLMPDAPIIWLRRDPLDTAWSCFHTYFARGVPWSWSQETIAAHFALEDRLFAFWQARLGGRLLCVDYEALVTDPGVWIPRIVAHTGLPQDPHTLAPHKTERAVLTSSVAQVRQPISRSAIGSGDRYRHHLTPFLDAYMR
ncbi:sulfotransferase [Sphingomonas sp. ZB1N12]|uniref:tetratricopeptide repeat-containing sulfotransferase family protein n=1 Tax=Sphingomonas arabinosi TaxID=3096160 RepID=UPI002FCBFC64